MAFPAPKILILTNWTSSLSQLDNQSKCFLKKTQSIFKSLLNQWFLEERKVKKERIETSLRKFGKDSRGQKKVLCGKMTLGFLYAKPRCEGNYGRSGLLPLPEYFHAVHLSDIFESRFYEVTGFFQSLCHFADEFITC